MTRRPIQWPAGWWLIPALLLGILAWVVAFAAFAQDTFAWTPDTRVTIQPTAQPGAVAEVVFLNQEIHTAFGYTFDLTLDGLTVTVVMEINAAGGAADRMTVTPPEGYIAVPDSVLVDENGAGVIHIYEDAIG
jgi:hypothetical protein